MNRRDFLKLSSVLPAVKLSGFNAEIADLSTDKKYLVIVTADEGWELPFEDRDKVEREILWGFQEAGIDPSNVGVIILFGLSMKIVEVTNETDKSV